MTLVVDIIFLLKNKREREKQTHEQTIYRKSSTELSGQGLFISTKFEKGLNREGVLIPFSEDDGIVEKPRHSDTKLEVMQPKIKNKSELPSRE